MAQYQASYPRRGAAAGATPRVSGWAVGFTVFASIMLAIIGMSHFIAGIAAISDDEFYVIRENFALEIDTTAWGWIHMIGGAIVLAAGIALMGGAVWARVIAVLVATVSAIWAFYSIPYYPVWSILIIALDVCVIWALTMHGGDILSQSAE